MMFEPQHIRTATHPRATPQGCQPGMFEPSLPHNKTYPGPTRFIHLSLNTLVGKGSQPSIYRVFASARSRIGNSNLQAQSGQLFTGSRKQQHNNKYNNNRKATFSRPQANQTARPDIAPSVPNLERHQLPSSRTISRGRHFALFRTISRRLAVATDLPSTGFFSRPCLLCARSRLHRPPGS